MNTDPQPQSQEVKENKTATESDPFDFELPDRENDTPSSCEIGCESCQ